MGQTPEARIAVVGCGLIGREHLRAWTSVRKAVGSGVEIVAVCDPLDALAESSAAEVAAWQGSKPLVFSNFDEMLACVPIDGLDVCLPVYLHRAAACAAFAHGVHVLMEKPLAATMTDAYAILEAARQSGCLLAFAENHRRALSIRIARWLIHDQGRIGVPEIVHAQRSRYQAPSEAPWHWRASRRASGGGWAIDNGAHLLDTLQYLFGPVASVSAAAKRTADRPLVREKGEDRLIDEREDFLAGMLFFDSGMTGVFSNVSGLPGDERFLFSVQGTQGAITDSGGELFHAPLPSARIRDLSGDAGQLQDYRDDYFDSLDAEERERLFPHGLSHDFAIECADFLRAIRGYSEYEIDGTAALRTLATSLAFYESAVTGKSVTVADVLSGKASAYQATIAIDCQDPSEAPALDLGSFRSRWR
jgi:predicted dehydrogenase